MLPRHKYSCVCLIAVPLVVTKLANQPKTNKGVLSAVVLNLFELATHNFDIEIGGTPKCKKETNIMKLSLTF
jgi:hypothetical protein